MVSKRTARSGSRQATAPWIDLRSDTVTQPTAAMRRAMAQAEVGDDVYGEDPTANRLQEEAADLFGKEAALFVPTGTMGNQIALKLHTTAGQEAILEEKCHIYNYELAAMAVFSAVLPRPVRGQKGILSWDQIESAIQPPQYYRSQTGVICLENTHNMAGGTLYTLEHTRRICKAARRRRLPVHLDGARLFNAAVALETSVRNLSTGVDTVMVTLSKGLCAPVGSLLLGSRAHIEEGRVLRKRMGGGMGQVGVLAAAARIALLEMPARLAEDHANARALAGGLQEFPDIAVAPEVPTNILIVELRRQDISAQQVADGLRQRGVLMGAISPREIRLVTHNDFGRKDIPKVLSAFRYFFKGLPLKVRR
ncbi:MAG: threonine aldolase family protein [Acidobacteriota bacterium]